MIGLALAVAGARICMVVVAQGMRMADSSLVLISIAVLRLYGVLVCDAVTVLALRMHTRGLP